MPSNKRSQKFDEGSSKNCFCSQEYLIHKNDHNLSYSSSLANFRNHVLYHTEQPIKKTLKESDVSVNLNRLFLSKTEVEQYFLPMLKDDENVKDGVEVCAYDDYGNVYSLVFKMWADKYYVLNDIINGGSLQLDKTSNKTHKSPFSCQNGLPHEDEVMPTKKELLHSRTSID
ncbi:hypothetical protein DEO72_LG5g51 [Vigna unguiculata]|uniref:Uncharacterized protein n=1 Tax=Vigna unguiculata TaxID=3917 RepID=A0A4D6LTU0_VIGUN|nr:hypothetical protein DEO72_LG5g51 [Vigna unguiculata]